MLDLFLASLQSGNAPLQAVSCARYKVLPLLLNSFLVTRVMYLHCLYSKLPTMQVKYHAAPV